MEILSGAHISGNWKKIMSNLDEKYAFSSESSDQDDQSPLFPIKVDGRWGYINIHGDVVIAPQFSQAGNFSDDLALVTLKPENPKPSPRRTPWQIFLDNISRLKVSEDIETRKKSYAFINPTGSIAFELNCDFVDDFSEGLTRFRIGDKYYGKWGFLDKNGKVVIEPKCNHVESFSEGRAEIKKNHKSGFIDREGNPVIAAVYDEAFPFSQGLALVRDGNMTDRRMGFIDKTGNLVIDYKFGYALSFSDGVAAVSQLGVLSNNNWGYIDLSGCYIIQPQFLKAFPFKESRAFVSESSSIYGDIEKKSKLKMIGLEFGLIASDGAFISNERYMGIGRFSEGLCSVAKLAKPEYFRDRIKPGKNGFINKHATLKIPYQFDKAENFENGLARVRVDGKWGYIDKNGEYVFEPTS